MVRNANLPTYKLHLLRKEFSNVAIMEVRRKKYSVGRRKLY
jgi:hypothetical protein